MGMTYQDYRRLQAGPFRNVIKFELPEGVNLLDAALIVHAIFEELGLDYNNIATETGSNIVTVVGVEKKGQEHIWPEDRCEGDA